MVRAEATFFGRIVFTSAICVGAIVGVRSAQAGPYTAAGIPASSSQFVEWANSKQVVRGPQNITNPTGPVASFGVPDNAKGPTDNVLVSLGDGGQITVGFAQPIVDGPGPDFAVFENGSLPSGNSAFLELGFVDVSSDGVNFFRFPSVSLTPTTSQLTNAGLIDRTNLNNLAGKDLALFGTGFDLSELANVSPNLDVNNVKFVRVTDVIGDINPTFASRDSLNNIINDPYPTAFASGGFDFDAIGVINAVPEPSGITLIVLGLTVLMGFKVVQQRPRVRTSR